MKVLIIEDDKEISRFISKGLEQLGHLVETAFDGLNGLAYSVSEQYDVIVLDRLLPKLDGLSLLKALRSEGIKNSRHNSLRIRRTRL